MHQPPRPTDSVTDSVVAAPPSAAGTWTTPALLAAAAVFVGLAVRQNDGNYSPAAVAWLTAGLAAAGLAVAGPALPAVERRGAKAVGGVLAAALVVQGVLIGTRLPVRPQEGSPPPLAFPAVAAAAAAFAVLLLPAVFSTRRAWRVVQRAAFAGLIIAWVGMAHWTLRAVPVPMQDVVVFQHDASVALLKGENPYAIDFPDLSRGTSPFYAPGTQVYKPAFKPAPPQPLPPGPGNDAPQPDWFPWRLDFGFVYPPLSLLMAAPAFIWGPEQDTRWAQLVSIALAAVLMAYAGRSPLGPPAAALFLLAPGGLYVLSQGWTEPFVVVLLAAAVFCAGRAPRLLPVALGLFWASKQYVVLSAPLALLLVPVTDGAKGVGRLPLRRALVLAVKAAAVAAVVTVPFVLWDVKAFWRSAVALQFHQPFRSDALSYVSALARAGGPVPPSAVAFAALAGVTALALRRLPRTPAAFAAGVGVTFFAFFALNKQAFANYYYFVVGAACCAVATAAPVATTGPDLPAPMAAEQRPSGKRQGRGRR